MKHRSTFITVYLCLLALLAFGLGELFFVDREERPSPTENRMLSAFPELSAESVFSGRFMDGLEDFLSDGFFFRDEAAAVSARTMGLFSLPDSGPATGEIDAERLFAPAAEPTPERSDGADGADRPEGADAETEPAAVSAERDAALWLVDADGERRNLISYPAEDVTRFAQLLNEYRAQLPEDGRLCFIVPPVTAVAGNLSGSSRYTDWGSDVDELLQPLVDEGVQIFDATDILRPYMGKIPLYPISDHHWLPVSASLAAEAMLAFQGVPPEAYSEYLVYLSNRGDRVVFDRDALSGMSYSPDVIEIIKPQAPTSCYLLQNLSSRTPSVYINSSGGGLLSYLGGLNGPWRLIETEYHTGRRALVLGDSFTLTFAPFLAPYYDLILMTDLRDSLYSYQLSGASVSEYIRYYEIDDIYMLYSTYSPFTSELTQEPLRRHLYED